MDIAKFTLHGLLMPEHLPIRRESLIPEKYLGERLHLLHEDRLVVYDAVRSADGTGLILTCPPLNNLWPALRDGLRVEGKRPRRTRRHRIFQGGTQQSELIRLRAPEGTRITLRLGGRELVLPVRDSETAAFHGRRLLMTVSRNNDLDWIAAWARFHVRAHGADAIVLYDNASDRYDPDEIVKSLSGIEGLDVVRVVGAPYKYGCDVDLPNRRIYAFPLQNAIFNLTRLDMGAKVQAVLNCDVDELVIPTAGQNVFDEARSALRGGIAIGGSWVYPATPDSAPCAQHHHIWRATPDKTCPPKWCARPAGIFCRLDGWNGPHAFGGKWMKWTVGLGKKSPHPGFKMAHCRGTTTGWKTERFDQSDFPDELTRDPVLERALNMAIP